MHRTTRTAKLVRGLVQMTGLGIVVLSLGVFGDGVSTALVPRSSQGPALQTTTDILDCVFSRRSDPAEAAHRDVKWFISGRVVPHLSAEWEFSVRRAFAGQTAVVLVRVEGSKLLGRPETAQANTCEDLLSTSRVVRRELTTDECKPLRTVVSHLEHMKLAAIPDPSIRVDSSEYAISAGTTEGEAFQWLVSARPDDPKTAHPLAAWSEDLRRAFESCPSR